MATGLDQPGQHWTAGGRVAYKGSDLFSLGASYRQKRFYGQMGFHEVAGDLSVHPTEWMEVIGEGVVELTDPRPKEVVAAIRTRPRRNLMIGAGYRFVSLDLFIPRSSIFSALFAGNRPISILLNSIVIFISSCPTIRHHECRIRFPSTWPFVLPFLVR